MCLEVCSSSASCQGPARTVRPSCLHASAVMEVIIYQRDFFFHFNCNSFLAVSGPYANVAMENGRMHREISSDEATQPHARLETPFYGQRHDHLQGSRL